MLALVFSYYDKLLIVEVTLWSNLIPANSFLIFTWVGIQHINIFCLGLSGMYLSQFKVILCSQVIILRVMQSLACGRTQYIPKISLKAPSFQHLPLHIHGTMNTLQSVGCSNNCVNNTLIISPQCHILEMTAWSSNCFVQLYSLRMGQGGPKHVAVL